MNKRMETGKTERIDRAVLNGDSRTRCEGMLPDAKGHLIFWSMLVLGLLLDLWTKRAVFAWLENEPGQSTQIFGRFLTFRLALNTGAAFGIFHGRHLFLIAVAAIALLIILGVFLFGRTHQRIVQAALGLFGAGVSGNLWDRVVHNGQVRDFIDVMYWPGRHWHTFNVADAMLCIAVGLLVAATLFTDWSCRRHAPPRR
jgi:signal peptidase II